MKSKSFLAQEEIKPIKPTQEGFGELNHLTEHLMAYSINRLDKFPKAQKWQTGLGGQIFYRIVDASELIYQIAAYNPSFDREDGLRRLSVIMRTLQSMIKVSYQLKYISRKNWHAWATKTEEIDHLAISMAMYLQRVRTNANKKQ